MSDDTESIRPWAKMTRETGKAYAAFGAYLELGPTRSIVKAVEKLGKRPGYVRQMEKWSSRWDWVRRSDAFDAEQLLQRMNQRVEVREVARQKLYDRADDLIDRLLDLADGTMDEGDTDDVRDKHKNIVGSTPRVPARVRAQVMQHALAVCGINAPRRVELTGEDGDQIRIQARAALGDLPVAALLAIAAGLGVDV